MTAVAPRRIALAVLLAALVLAAVPACPRNWETWPSAPTAEPGVVRVPCRPVVVGGWAECTGTADIPPGTHTVIYEPAPASSAPMTCGPVHGRDGGEMCATSDLAGPRARLVAAVLIELRVRRSLVGAP